MPQSIPGKSPSYELDVTTLGRFEVRRKETVIDAESWRRRTNQTLFKVFLVYRGRPLTQEQLIDALYPNEPAASGLLRTLRARISELRRALEPSLAHGSRSSYIKRVDRGTYLFPSESPCRVDFEMFRECAARGDAYADQGKWSEALRCYDRAVDLYRGEFLPADLYEEWAQPLREQLAKEYVHVLTQAARGFGEQGEYRKVLAYCDRALDADDLCEAAYRHKAAALSELGQREEAIQVCRSCIALFEEDGIDPGPEILDLYDALRSRERPKTGRSVQNSLPVQSRPPVKSRLPIQSRLPGSITPFVGRDEDLARVESELIEGDHRLVAILGPGGIGKTRLAVEVARRAAEAFGDGVVYATVPQSTDREQLAAVLAEALGLGLQGKGTPSEQLIRCLQERHILLLIDDGEHLGGASDLLEEVLESTDVRVLVASRERLHIPGERIVEIGGLGIPDQGAETKKPQDLMKYGAVRLFVERIQSLDQGFSLEGNASEVVRICRLVGGIPLALELAASWGRILSPREIARGIERENARFLEQTDDATTRKHRSMHAVFEHSWARLSGEEKTAFARLCVFRGSISRRAAEEVAGTAPSTMMSLRDKSLVERIGSDRFVIHNLLRQLGEEKLRQDEKVWRETHARHASFFARYLAGKRKELRGKEQIEALKELSKDAENLEAAWTWLVEHQNYSLIRSMLDAYYRYHELKNRWSELAGLLDRALGGDATGGRAVEVQTCVRTQPPEDPFLASLLSKRGMAAFHLGRLEEAKALLRRGVAAVRNAKDKTLQAELTVNLGKVLHSMGEMDESKRLLEQSLKRYRETKDDRGVAETLSQLGVLCRQSGRRDEAKELLEEGLRLYRGIGDPTEIAGTLLNLGTFYGDRRENDQARRHFQESLDMAKQIGHRILILLNTANLGYLAYLDEEYDAAMELYLEALGAAEEIGNRENAVHLYCHIGLSALKLGRLEDAHRYLHHGFEKSLEIHAVPLTIGFVAALAQYWEARGAFEQGLVLHTAVAGHPSASEADRASSREHARRLEASLPQAQADRAKKRGEGLSSEKMVELVRHLGRSFKRTG